MKGRRVRTQRRREEREARKLARRKGWARRAWVGQVVEIGLPVALFMGMILLILLFYPRVVSASVFEPVLASHASMFGALFGLLGEEVRVSQDTITSSSFAFRIIAECTSLIPTLVLLSAVVVFPAPWRMKMWGAVIGALALAVVNVVRVVALMYTAKFSPSVLEFTHLVVWQGLMILLGVGIWVAWLSYLRRRGLA